MKTLATLIRMRQYDPMTEEWEALYPRTHTTNIVRSDGTLTVDESLLAADAHMIDGSIHIQSAIAYGGSSTLEVNLPLVELSDGLTLRLSLRYTLVQGVTLNYNSTGPLNIVGTDNVAISGGQAAGSIILVAYSEANSNWLLINNDLPTGYIPVHTSYIYTATDITSSIELPEFDYSLDLVSLNYYQSVLQQDINYDFDPDNQSTVRFINFTLEPGDRVVCTITKFVPTIGGQVVSTTHSSSTGDSLGANDVGTITPSELDDGTSVASMLSILPSEPVANAIISASGNGVFIANDNPEDEVFKETIISHGLEGTPTKVHVHSISAPIKQSDGTWSTIKNMWYYADSSSIYVGIDGNHTGLFSWYAEI